MVLGLDFPRFEEATDASSPSVVALMMLSDRLQRNGVGTSNAQMGLAAHLFFPFFFGSVLITSSSSSGTMSSRNSNNSLSSSSFRYWSSSKSCSCFSNCFEMSASNFLNALLAVASRRGRRYQSLRFSAKTWQSNQYSPSSRYG